MNTYRPWLALLAAAGLAACSSTGPRHEAPTRDRDRDAPGGSTSVPVTVKPSTAGKTPGRIPVKKGGGYYKDDGPPEDAPDNLADIPDAVPRREPLHRFANNPYNVFGQNYVPATRLGPYREQGVGSWYGRKFHGVRTSSGEPYDMFGMTAAHPTLPIPSYARVTSLDTGKSVVVRINDRGPFHPGRVIDLTYTAAWKLGYVDQGSARVEVEAILPDDASPQEQVAVLKPTVQRQSEARPVVALETTRSNGSSGVFLQLGAFSTRQNAETLRDHAARELGDMAGKLVISQLDGKFKLRVGPFASADAARNQSAIIAERLGMRPFLALN